MSNWKEGPKSWPYKVWCHLDIFLFFFFLFFWCCKWHWSWIRCQVKPSNNGLHQHTFSCCKISLSTHSSFSTVSKPSSLNNMQQQLCSEVCCGPVTARRNWSEMHYLQWENIQPKKSMCHGRHFSIRLLGLTSIICLLPGWYVVMF